MTATTMTALHRRRPSARCGTAMLAAPPDARLAEPSTLRSRSSRTVPAASRVNLASLAFIRKLPISVGRITEQRGLSGVPEPGAEFSTVGWAADESCLGQDDARRSRSENREHKDHQAAARLRQPQRGGVRDRGRSGAHQRHERYLAARESFCLALPGPTLTVDPVQPALSYQDHASLPATLRLRIARRSLRALAAVGRHLQCGVGAYRRLVPAEEGARDGYREYPV